MTGAKRGLRVDPPGRHEQGVLTEVLWSLQLHQCENRLGYRAYENRYVTFQRSPSIFLSTFRVLATGENKL